MDLDLHPSAIKSFKVTVCVSCPVRPVHLLMYSTGGQEHNTHPVFETSLQNYQNLFQPSMNFNLTLPLLKLEP